MGEGQGEVVTLSRRRPIRKAGVDKGDAAGICLLSERFRLYQAQSGLTHNRSDLASECSPQLLFSPRALAREAGSSSKLDQE